MLRVDIVAGRVFRDRVNDDGSLVPVRTYQVPGTVGAITPVAGDDGWLLAAGRGFVHLTREGIFHPIAEVAPAGTRMNDAACDPQGRFWAGTLADDHHDGGGALYRLDCDGQIELVLSDLTIANGLGWSPDGATMYLVDSGPRLIHAFDFDADRGTIARGRVLVSLAEEIGAPDGLTVDAAGDLWVAVYGGGCVHRYSPDGVLRETLDGPRRAEHLLRVRRTGAAPAVRHHRDRELERRAASRRTRGGTRLPVRHRRDRAPRITVSARPDLVEGDRRSEGCDDSRGRTRMTDTAENSSRSSAGAATSRCWPRSPAASGSISSDGTHTDSWLVTIDKGDLTVSHEPGAADCTIRGDKALFDELAGGRANAMSSVLRGALICTGDVELLFAIQRIFPARHASRNRVVTRGARNERRTWSRSSTATRSWSATTGATSRRR